MTLVNADELKLYQEGTKMSTEFTEAVPTLAEVDPLADNLATENAVVDLSDFADDAGGGPLPRGWYAAEVIEGFATRKGKQIVTSDTVSADGASRNLLLAIRVTPKLGEPRTMLTRLNYRGSDFTPERLAYIKQSRDENKGVKGAWNDRDAQRSSLAIASLGQLQKAIGFVFVTAKGTPTAKLVGQKLEVRLTITDEGYNEVNGYAPVGTYTLARKAKS